MKTKLEQRKAVNQLPKSVVREIRTFSGSRGRGDLLRRRCSTMGIATAIQDPKGACRLMVPVSAERGADIRTRFTGGCRCYAETRILCERLTSPN